MKTILRLSTNLLLAIFLAACGAAAPAPTATATPAPTATPSPLPSPSPTLTSTATPAPTITPTKTPTPTPTLTLTSTSTLASSPTAGRTIKLEIINQTGYVVDITLESLTQPGIVYNLAIPDGQKMTFTIAAGTYLATTITCRGIKSTRQLSLTSNIRLTYLKCVTAPPSSPTP